MKLLTPKIRNFLSSGLVKNILSIGLGDAGSKLLTFFAFIYIARLFGPSDFGLIGLGMALVGFFIPVVDFGLGMIGTREISQKSSSLIFYVKTIGMIRFLLALISFLLIVLFILFYVNDSSHQLLFLFFGLGLFPSALTLVYAYQAVGKSQLFTLEKLLQGVLYFSGIFLLVHQGEQIVRVPQIALFSSFVSIIVAGVIFLWNRWESHIQVNLIETISLAKSSLPLFLPIFLSQFFIPMGSFALAYFCTISDVGIFSAITKILAITTILQNLIVSSFYPFLARFLGDSTKESFTLSLFFRTSLVTGFFIGGLCLIFSSEIINAMFGIAYLDASMMLIPLGIFIIVQFVSFTLSRLMPAMGREKEFGRIVTIGAIVFFVLCLPLAKWFGIVGVILAAFMSELSIVVYILKKISFKFIWTEKEKYLKSFFIPVLCIGLTFILKNAIVINWLFHLIIFTLMYFSGILLLKIILPREFSSQIFE